MSTERARYQISPAERARLAEQARRQELERQWQSAQVGRYQQQGRAAQLGRRYGVVVPEPPPLGSLTATDSDTAQNELRAALAATQRWTAELDRVERAGQDTVVARQVATVVAALTAERRAQSRTAAPTRTTRPTGAATESGARYLERDIAEAARIVARLDGDVPRPVNLDARVEVIGRTDERARPVLLEALRAEVRRLNATALRRRSDATALAYLRTAAEQTGDPGLTELVRAADRALAAGQPVELERLRAAAEATLREQQRERDRRFVEQAAVAAFAQLRYEVVTGFEVGTPDQGVLLRRTWGSVHAVQLDVDGDQIKITPVRLTPAGVDPPRDAGRREAERKADQAAERAVCADATEVWRGLPQHNVTLDGRNDQVDGLMPRRVAVRPDLINPALAERALVDTAGGDTTVQDEDGRTGRQRRPLAREREL